MDYLITTPKNPNYNGRTLGLKFERGKAQLTEHTYPKHLKRTVEEMVTSFKKDYGYTVRTLKETPREVVETEAEDEPPIERIIIKNISSTSSQPSNVSIVDVAPAKKKGGRKKVVANAEPSPVG